MADIYLDFVGPGARLALAAAKRAENAADGAGGAVGDVTEAKDEALSQIDTAKVTAQAVIASDGTAKVVQAQAWAQSPAAPDGGTGKSAKTWAGESGASASQALASRVATEAAASSSIASINVARDQALAAAGVVATFATKAAATAAIGSISNGQNVLVQADESNAYRRTIYTKTSGAYVLLFASGLVFLPPSNGIDDTAMLNAYLSLAGAIGTNSVLTRLFASAGSNYIISSTLVIYSNTVLDMTGATVTLKAGSNTNMLANRAYLGANRTLADAVTTAGSATITSATAAFSAADVGRSIVIAGAGNVIVTDGSVASAIGPHCATITSVESATSATMSMAAATTTSGAAAKLYDRDRNIQVIGGRWVAGTNGGIDLSKMRTIFRRIDGLTIKGDLAVEATSSGKYGISIGDVTRLRVDAITFANDSDGVHLVGPIRDFHISNIKGVTHDDLVAIGTSDYPAYADTQGDVSDGIVSGLFPRSTTIPRAVLMFANTGSVLRRITVEKIRGVMNTAVQLQNNSTDITIRDIKPETAAAPIMISIGKDAALATGNHESIIIDDVLQPDFAGAGKDAVVGFNGSSGPGLTVGSVSITRLRRRGTATNNLTVRINGADIGVMTLDDHIMRAGSGGGGVGMLQIYDRIGVLNLNRINSNTGTLVSATVTAAMTGDTTAGSSTISNVTGTLYPGQPLIGAGIPAGARVGTFDSATATATMVNESNTAVTATATATGVAITATQRLPEINLKDVRLEGGVRVFLLATTSRIVYHGLTVLRLTEFYAVNATGRVEVRGSGFSGAVGNATIAAGGVLTNIASDWPRTDRAGGLPTVTLGPNTGTGATSTIVGSDKRGIITITPGSTGVVAGLQATVTYTALSGNNPVPILTPLNAAAVAAGGYIDNGNSNNRTNFLIKTVNALTGAAVFGYEICRNGA